MEHPLVPASLTSASQPSRHVHTRNESQQGDNTLHDSGTQLPTGVWPPSLTTSEEGDIYSLGTVVYEIVAGAVHSAWRTSELRK